VQRSSILTVWLCGQPSCLPESAKNLESGNLQLVTLTKPSSCVLGMMRARLEPQDAGIGRGRLLGAGRKQHRPA
jgi:hypothetical protein